MKKVIIMLSVIFAVSAIFGERVYYPDGTFFELKRNLGVNALKLDEVSLKSHENYNLKLRIGESFIVIPKNGVGNLPVYLYGIHPIIADNKLFYEGTKNAQYLSAKYKMKLVEIMQNYNYTVFETSSDSIKTAQQIVENNDGFAFANIMRKMEFKANPVKYPIMDKYYKSNYQWSLKNTGTGITPSFTNITTVKNADVRYDKAVEFVYNAIEANELPDFEVMKVAIMDSGVDFDQPDLKNKLEDGYNMVRPGETGNPGTIVDDPMYGTGGYAHGTDCAGVSAAEGNTIGTAGICPWCGIYPVTYMEGGSGSGTSEQVLLDVYQKYVDDTAIVAINCSFGPMAGMGDVPVSNAEKTSHANFLQNGRAGLGGAIVYASGNDGVNASYYKLLDNVFKFKRNGIDVEAKVVSVGASSGWDTRVAYSNYSPKLDVIAPSLSMTPLLGIATTYLVGYGDMKDDKNYTNQFSGTSSAAPVVTGFFGVIFSVNPKLTLEEATEILHESSDKVNPETGFWDKDGHSVKFGYGRINLHKAVRLAAGLAACESPVDEIENNIDDNCDGFVDEGFSKDISKVGAACTKAEDCANADFLKENVECLSGEFKSYILKNGYCTILNSTFDCPDGTGQYGAEQGEKNCLLECNDDNPCPENMVCTDPILGKCFPACEKDEDCVEGTYCSEDKTCERNPSEPMGECETSADCLYNGMCVTYIPDGLCVVQCLSDISCGENGAKCVTMTFPSVGDIDVCTPSCEKDADCRSFGSSMQMKCHSLYNEKEGVCGMACEANADCKDENAECKDSQCVLIGSISDDDVTTDEDADVDPDAENTDESSFENDLVPDETNTSKKSSGCSAVML